MMIPTHVQQTRPQWETTAEVWALAALTLLLPEVWKTQLNQSPSQLSCKTLASTQDRSNKFPFANDSLSHVSEATRRPDKKTWMNLPLSKAVCCREERGDMLNLKDSIFWNSLNDPRAHVKAHTGHSLKLVYLRNILSFRFLFRDWGFLFYIQRSLVVWYLSTRKLLSNQKREGGGDLK